MSMTELEYEEAMLRSLEEFEEWENSPDPEVRLHYIEEIMEQL